MYNTIFTKLNIIANIIFIIIININELLNSLINKPNKSIAIKFDIKINIKFAINIFSKAIPLNNNVLFIYPPSIKIFSNIFVDIIISKKADIPNIGIEISNIFIYLNNKLLIE